MQKAGPLVMPTGRKSEGLQSAKTTADVREISRSSHWTLLGTIRVTAGYITVPAGTMYIPTAQIFPCLRHRAREVTTEYSRKFNKSDQLFASDVVGDGNNNVVGPFESAQNHFFRGQVVVPRYLRRRISRN